MAAEDVEFQQNAGTPDQLPQGAASEMNAQLPTKQPDAGDASVVGEAEDAAAAVPVEPAQASDYEPQFVPDSEDDDFIAGPTLRPDEPQSMGASPRQPMSARVRRSLPVLQQIASSPDASPELQTLVALLVREAGR